MSLVLHTATYTTNLGVLLSNAPAEIRVTYENARHATVYADQFGLTPLTNPTTNGSGVLSFYTEPGEYSVGIGPYRFTAYVGGTSSSVFAIAGDTTRARKLVTQTITTATLASDPDLQLPVVANAVYEFRMFFKGYSDVGNDFRLGFTVPAGSTVDWVSPSGPEPLPVFQSGEEVRIDGSSDSSVVITARGFIYTGGTAGQFIFRRSMWTAPGTMEIQAGSWLTLERIA